MVALLGPIVSLVNGTVTVSSRLAEAMRRHNASAREADDVREILGLRRRLDTVYRHDSAHPLYPDTLNWHPDNERALAAAAGGDYAYARARGLLKQTEAEPGVGLVSNLVLIGGPMAEGLTRSIFGYEADGGEHGSLSATRPPVELPFRMVVSTAEIDPRVFARRRVAGRGWVDRPNWHIEGPDRHKYRPQLGSDGRIVGDYLLITSIPNLLDDQAEDSGHRIVTITGPHGTGTRGIELLAKDKAAVSAIRRGFEEKDLARPFQLLFHVGDIKHRRLSGSSGTRIRLAAEPTFLPDTPELWDEARRVMRQNFSTYAQPGTRTTDSA